MCECKASGGYYLKDGITTEVTGPCKVIGINDYSFGMAKKFEGMNFNGHVIQKSCPTVKYL